MTSEFHSYIKLEVSYMFCNVLNSLLPLVNVQKFLHYLYTCRVQQFIYGNNSSVYWTLLALSRDFQFGIYIAWIFIAPI